ncbi:cation:proton antiporter [Natronobacterium gregoryi]|uniref:Kef-type K+ transport system, membrane component n=2 Tax=Natronobacterium gregoryi TaxID=44930 RepID=L0AM29_NATGS|nr:cation:proton antiporter [Natronobacterium gregoryi]AFZ74090.1 Kef-type K+ transport system, membrane component [Natronobacterium gregoryi SP2]PLK18629.1 potassium transporter Kef [Natronobacterium gregoryi SP2]SFJ61864.1 monovalent cation:H+ antiporter-2, CPA2 family [Natronobacterium gregoryi]
MTEQLVVTLAVVFVAAGLLSLVANQFGLSPIPFYIIAGLIAGSFETVTQEEIIVLAQWGIAFLVFVFAIRIDFGDLESILRDAELAAVTQLIVVAPLAFAVGYVFGDLFGFENQVRNAVYFSAAVVLSSSLVGGVVLGSEIRQNLVHGRLASSVHFFDDLVAITLLLILSTEVVTADAIAAQIGYGVLFVVAGLLIYRHGFRLLVRLADGDGELVLVGSISILITFIAAAEYVGLSIVVGAFAAGIAIRSDGTQALDVQNGIDSITDFFVAIFFVTVGALVVVPFVDLDWSASIEVLSIAAALAVLVLVLNPVVHTLSFVSEGYDARTAFLASSSLNQVSEFALIIAIQALILTETIAAPMFDAIILAAAATMVLTFLARRTEDAVYETIVARLFRGQRTRKVDDRSSVDDLADHVVVVGYGRIGRRVVETLEELDCPYVVLENDPVLWDELDVECRNYVLGDALSAYPWEKAQPEDAALILSTVDHRPVSEAVLERDHETDADILLRSESAEIAGELLESGATHVAVPNVLAGEQLLATVDALAAGETDPETLEREQREYFQALERYGFATRNERV